MEPISTQDGVTVAVLKKFEDQVLSKIIAIKDRVEQGGKISEQEADFLNKLLIRLAEEKAGVDNHPEWQSFYGRLLAMCHEVIAKGLENEHAAGAQSAAP